MIVLDTDVVSELVRRNPAAPVTTWVSRQPADEVCTTSVTLAEVRYGIARLPAGRRRHLLDAAADDVFGAFDEQVLPFDTGAAVHHAHIVVERERAGTPISGFDAQIAAVCRAHRARLVTRNTADFDGLGLELVNPWTTDR